MRRKILAGLLIVLALSTTAIGCTKRQSNEFTQYWSDRAESNEVIRQTNADRIEKYHEFEDLYHKIESQLISISGLMSDGHSVGAELSIVNSWIGEYNSQSRQFDRAQWKAKDLPYQLEYVSKENLNLREKR